MQKGLRAPTAARYPDLALKSRVPHNKKRPGDDPDRLCFGNPPEVSSTK